MEKIPYTMEYDNEKYTLFEQVCKTQFLHNFIDKKYERDCMFVILDGYNASWFYDDINEHLGLINDRYEGCEIAVYNKVWKLYMPDVVCKNCSHFVEHYAKSSNLLGFFELMEGHCNWIKGAETRRYEDRPYNDDCFRWNSRCRGIIERIGKQN